MDPSGKVAVTVNYTNGSLAAYGLEPDGKLGEAFYVDQHTGKPLSPKQPGPKQHGIQFSKDNKYMYHRRSGAGPGLQLSLRCRGAVHHALPIRPM